MPLWPARRCCGLQTRRYLGQIGIRGLSEQIALCRKARVPAGQWVEWNLADPLANPNFLIFLEQGVELRAIQLELRL